MTDHLAAYLEALRILALWRGGADEQQGITPDLLAWCLEQTGDIAWEPSPN